MNVPFQAFSRGFMAYGIDFSAMHSLRSALIFAIGMVIFQVITYLFAGIFAQDVLGAAVFYPPSPDALCFLRDPSSPDVQALIIPAQILRGLLFAAVLLPFRKTIWNYGRVRGGLLMGTILFVLTYVAASGGMIEHMVYFIPVPSSFYAITFVEVLIQTMLLGLLVMWWEGRLNRDFYIPQEEPPVYIE
jgi:hypothetical protein